MKVKPLAYLYLYSSVVSRNPNPNATTAHEDSGGWMDDDGRGKAESWLSLKKRETTRTCKKSRSCLRPIGVMLRALLLILALSASSAEDEEEGRSALLLYKKMDPPDGYSVGAPINVTLSVFNRGLGDAYSLVVNDDNWKSDKFRIVSGANNFTLDYLNHGDQYVHE